MTSDDSVKRSWERTLEDDSIDHEEVLADGGEGIAEPAERIVLHCLEFDPFERCGAW